LDEWIKKGDGNAELTTVAGGKLWVMKDSGKYWLKDEKGGMAAINYQQCVPEQWGDTCN
jgi:hypothetical protein